MQGGAPLKGSASLIFRYHPQKADTAGPCGLGLVQHLGIDVHQLAEYGGIAIQRHDQLVEGDVLVVAVGLTLIAALVTNAGITLHIDLLSGEEPHHISEAIFKAFGRALDQATGIETRLKGTLPSTKGIL